MENSPVRPSPQDDIDFYSFFGAIGKMFKSLGRFFRDVFLFLFDKLIFRPYYLLVKYAKFLVPLLILVLAAGIWADFKRPPLYRGSMTLTPHYGSGQALYAHIDYLNTLAGGEQTDKLQSLLGLSPDEAASLKSFEVEPEPSPSKEWEFFADFMQNIDTAALGEFTFEDFKKSLKEKPYHYPLQTVTVIAERPDVFGKLNAHFDTLFEGHPTYGHRKAYALQTRRFLKEEERKALAQTDSLREAVNLAIKSATKVVPPAPGSIVIGQTRVDIPEEKYHVWEIKNELLRHIALIDRQTGEQNEVLRIEVPFPETGAPHSSLLSKSTVVYLILFWLLLTIAAAAAELLDYMHRKIRQLEQNSRA
ncbi:MAG: hypothetical protein GXO27_04270 [Chlorobi bacterium]|nr:hypothetical protein [Chlorobiota bacterium]